MAQLGNGNLWFGVTVQDLTDQGLQAIKDKLEKLNVSISNVDTNNLRGQVQSALTSGGGYSIDNVSMTATRLKSQIDTFFKSYKGKISQFEIEDSVLRNEIAKKLTGAFSIAVDPSVTQKTFDLKPDQNLLKASVKSALENTNFTVNVTPKVTQKAVVQVNKTELESSITSALKGMSKSINVTANLTNPNVKLVADTKQLISDVEKALTKGGSGNGYGIKIYVDQMKLSSAVQAALRQMNVVPNNPGTNDVRQARIALLAAKAQAQLALAQQRAAGAVSNHARAYTHLNLGMGSSISMALNLKSLLSTLFSTITIQQFVRGLVQIGGEFQKQQVALRAMLGDVGKADKLFSQLKGLAIESPFKFSELASYGKQLAAFSVPYEELYDTTKRLSDISAGLGVDMSRIILAFGQIRSAKVLKGTELRQLTEAGIPMVDALSKKLTEMEGRVVSAGEVFARISKKEISFDMVKDVLWEMTNVGGQFYNMQEELTKTLSGRWAKFVDSYEIMLSEMANDTGGMLNVVIDALTALMDHFDDVAYAAISLGSSLMVFKSVAWVSGFFNAFRMGLVGMTAEMLAADVAAKTAAGSLTVFESKAYKVAQFLAKLKTSVTALGMTGGVVALIAAFVGVATYISMASSEMDKLNKKLGEIREKSADSVTGLVIGYSQLVKQLEGVDSKSTKYKNTIKQINSTYGQYLDKLWEENESYKNLKESIDSVTESIQRKKDMEAIEQERAAVDDYLSDKFTDAREDIEEALKRQLAGLDDTTIKKMTNEMIVLLQRGNDVHDVLEKVFNDLNKAPRSLNDTALNGFGLETYGTVEGRLSFYVEQYKKIIDEQNKLYDSIDTVHSMNYSEQDKTINAINDKYERFKESQAEGIVQTEAEIERLKELREYYTAPIKPFDGSDLGKTWDIEPIGESAEKNATAFKNWGNEVDGVYGSLEKVTERKWDFGKGLPENSAEVRKLDAEIKAAELSMQDWVITADKLANTPHLGDFGIESAAKSLAPSDDDKSNILDYLTNVAESVKEAREEIERLNSVPINLRNEDSWGSQFAVANAKVMFGKQLEEALNVDLSKFEKTKSNKKSSSTKDEQNEKWKNRINLIKEAYSEYDKWNKIMDKDSALAKVNESGMFDELDELPKSFDDVVRMLEKVKDEMGDPSKLTEQRKSTYRSLLQTMFGIELDKAKEEFDSYSNQIELFVDRTRRQWEIYKNFVDSTGDKKLASTMAFGAVSMANSNTQTYADFIKNKLKDEIGEMDYTALFALTDEQLTQQFNKNGKAIKTLLDELKDAMDANVDEENDIYLQSLEDVADYYSKREKIMRDYQKKIDVAKRMGNYELAANLEVQRDSEIMSINPDTLKFYSATLALTQEEVNNTAHALKENLIKQMMAGKISAEDFSKGMRDINKATREYAEHQKKLSGKGILGYTKDEKFDLNIEELDAEVSAAALDMEKYRAIMKSSSEESAEYADAEINLAKAIDRHKKAQDKLNDVQDKKWSWDNLKDSLGDLADIFDAVSSALGNFGKMFESLGDESTADTLEGLGNIAGGLESIASGLSSGNVLQAITGSISGVTGIISSIAGMHDKKLDRAIRDSSFEVKKLSNEYKNLEGIIERQLGSVTKSQSKDMIDNLNKQYKEVNSQLLNEQDKKKSDKNAVEDYKQQLSELREQLNYFYEDLANEQYGADVKSWADDIAEAITGAFASGEDAAQAFDDTVGDIMRDVVNKMISLNVIQPAMEKLRKFLFGDSGIFTANSEKGTDLSESEAIGLSDELNKIKSSIAESKSIWDKINDATNGILEESSSKSGMSASIKGVTENTADLLSSYINGIRADVSKIVHFEEVIANALGIGNISQEQITRLDQIAQNTLRSADAASEIKNLLDSVTNGVRKLSVK